MPVITNVPSCWKQSIESKASVLPHITHQIDGRPSGSLPDTQRRERIMRGGRFGFKFCDTIIKLIRVVPGLSQGLVNNRGTIRYFCCNSPNEKRIRPIFMGRPLLFNGGIIRDINSLHLRHPEMSLVSATSKEAKVAFVNGM